MKRKALSLAHTLTVLLMIFIAMVPFYFLLVTALSEKKWRSIFVPQFYFGGFAEVVDKAHLGTAFFNSTVFTVVPLFFIIIITSSAGYLFARSEKKFDRVWYYLIIGSMMVPTIILSVPLYRIMRAMGGINTYWGVTLLLITEHLPFATFLYTNFIRSRSLELEEAARIDGCTRFQAFWRVVFPTLKPITATIVILDAVSLWNTYTIALLFLQKSEMLTVPLAISRFVNSYGAEWNLMAATAVLALLPPVIVFAAFQKYFIKGVMTGAVKG